MYAILGATGNTGKIVAETLLSKGEKVRAVGRSKDRLAPIAARGAAPFVADQTDSRALTRAFEGARTAYFMVPPNVASPDYRGFQAQVADAAAPNNAWISVVFVSVTIRQIYCERRHGRSKAIWA